jgi:Zn-dependent peptidase ImmA (M78 family)/transcriptional regulator with XRE-family HTH domain
MTTGSGSFGKFAVSLRRQKQLGLREAARSMGVSPSYLSQVERDVDEPSPRLLVLMSQLYQCPPSEMKKAAERGGVENRKPRTQMRTIEELRALYRLGGMFTSDEVEDMIRHMLRKRGLTDEQIEAEIAKFHAELPRMRGGDALFAADIKPRFLSKMGIAQLAYRILDKNGLDRSNYNPPTPIERLVEAEGISYIIDELPSTDGDPIVLGRTRWTGDQREITINGDLAESERECDGHRFRFTLGHEFFHAIEHLPLAGSSCGQLRRTAEFGVQFVDRSTRHGRSRAERSVERWARKGSARGLLTREDWREWQANTFASALLMPEWAVREHFERRVQAQRMDVSENDNCRERALEIAGGILVSGKVYVRTLAQLFDVSRQAMAIRLLDLGLVREVTG